MRIIKGTQSASIKRSSWLALAASTVVGAVMVGTVEAGSGSRQVSVGAATAPTQLPQSAPANSVLSNNPSAAGTGCYKPYPGKLASPQCVPTATQTISPALAAKGVMCGPSQLRFAFTNGGVGGYGPDIVQSIRFDNVSSSSCFLNGAPTVNLLTTTGHTMPVAPNPYYASHQALAGPGGQVVVNYGYPGDCTNYSNEMRVSKVIVSFPDGTIAVPPFHQDMAIPCGNPHIEDYAAGNKSQNLTVPQPGSVIAPKA